MMHRPNNPDGNAHRVITFLSRAELDFIDKISKDALFSAGAKLSRSKIISAIINVLSQLEIDGCGLSSKKQLEARVLKAIKKLSQAQKKESELGDESDT
ncbi:hypothetical protein ACFL1I_04290 [Candidatus Omnitrophota bacterium]